jgi:flagellar hook assembly protein FlgD
MPINMDITVIGPDAETSDKMTQVIEVFGSAMHDCRTRQELNLLGMAISVAGMAITKNSVEVAKAALKALAHELGLEDD